MRKGNERGIVTIPILVYCLIILAIVVGVIPLLNNTDHMFRAEMQRMQAGYNAEAGIWLGLHDWVGQGHTLPISKTYSLPSGSVQVNVQSIDPSTIKISSYGVTLNGKDAIEANYSLTDKRFTHWHKIIQY